MYYFKLLPDSTKVIYLSYISYNYIERDLKVIAKNKSSLLDNYRAWDIKSEAISLWFPLDLEYFYPVFEKMCLVILWWPKKLCNFIKITQNDYYLSLSK